MTLFKNIYPYWLIGTAFFGWLAFVHSPQLFASDKVQSNSSFLSHLIIAYVLYGSCIINIVLTPLLGHFYRRLHVLLGKTAMVVGVINFVVGFYLAWWPGRVGELPPLSFSIPITTVGFFQVLFQYLGYTSIISYRKASTDNAAKKMEALESHIFYMIALFAVCCVAPTGILFFLTFGYDDGFGVIFLLLCIASIRPFAEKLYPTTSAKLS